MVQLSQIHELMVAPPVEMKADDRQDNSTLVLPKHFGPSPCVLVELSKRVPGVYLAAPTCTEHAQKRDEPRPRQATVKREDN